MNLTTSAKVRRRRLDAGLSMEKLSQLSGVSMTAVWSIEHGKHKAREKTMRKIMDVLCQSRSKIDERAIRCRWCGQSIVGLTWDPFRQEVIVGDLTKRFTLKRGYFYHQDCLEEMKRCNEAFPD